MDRLIYTAMTGAQYLFSRQAILANNLANVDTTGFRADFAAMRAVPIQGQTAQPGTRVFAVETTTGSDYSQGPIETTGNSLDAAIKGPGWFTVQAPDGTEAYTRNGAFQVGSDGTLQLPGIGQVQGVNGPIAIPINAASVTIAPNGTVSVQTTVAPVPIVVGQLKMVNPPASNLIKGADGLFRTQDGQPASADPTVQLVSDALEGSNVNVIGAMTGMIEASRQYEMQMNLLTTAEQNDQKAETLVSA